MQRLETGFKYVFPQICAARLLLINQQTWKHRADVMCAFINLCFVQYVDGLCSIGIFVIEAIKPIVPVNEIPIKI